jgi:hypothetical protein
MHAMDTFIIRMIRSYYTAVLYPDCRLMSGGVVDIDGDTDKARMAESAIGILRRDSRLLSTSYSESRAQLIELPQWGGRQIASRKRRHFGGYPDELFSCMHTGHA